MFSKMPLRLPRPNKRLRLISDNDTGIDVGITFLGSEYLRTGNVWRWFMSSAEVERALDLIGLVPGSPRDGKQTARKEAEVQKWASSLCRE